MKIIPRFIYAEKNEEFFLIRDAWDRDRRCDLSFIDWLKDKGISCRGSIDRVNEIAFPTESEFLAFKLKYL